MCKVNKEVIDFADNIRGILAAFYEKYTSDAIVDFIPDITEILNRLTRIGP